MVVGFAVPKYDNISDFSNSGLRHVLTLTHSIVKKY